MRPWGEDRDARPTIVGTLHDIVIYSLAALIAAKTVWDWLFG